MAAWDVLLVNLEFLKSIKKELLSINKKHTFEDVSSVAPDLGYLFWKLTNKCTKSYELSLIRTQGKVNKMVMKLKNFETATFKISEE